MVRRTRRRGFWVVAVEFLPPRLDQTGEGRADGVLLFMRSWSKVRRDPPLPAQSSVSGAWAHASRDNAAPSFPRSS